MSIFLPNVEKKTYDGKPGRVPRRRDAPSRIVIHTTETARLPGYGEGSVAPHFTIGVGDPGSLPREGKGKVRIWQHVSLDRTASALKHKRGTPETNHMGAHCIQIECVTYIGDQDAHDIVGNKGKFPPSLSKALAGLIKQIVDTLGDININIHPESWSASGSYGEDAKQRMTDDEWAKFNGICGHQHVPHNTHWDPGAFDIDAFMKLLGGASPVTTATQPPQPVVFEDGDSHARVLIIRGVLQTLGYGEFVHSELYDAKVAAGVKALQKAQGTDIDGVWGPKTQKAARDAINAKLEW